MSIVLLDNVHKTYPLGKTEVHAVKGVSFEIEEGDFISIAGPSGSGKSTILNLIGCIDTPTEGTVYIDGTATDSLSDKEITSLRHNVLGFIFQSFNLVPVLDVFENVEFPLLLGKVETPKRERAEWIEQHTEFAHVLPRMDFNALKALVDRCDITIGNDTGPTHMAWAMNKPSITIFGPTPVSRVHVTDINKVVKSPSHVDPYKLNKEDFSIKEIDPEEIAELAKTLL